MRVRGKVRSGLPPKARAVTVRGLKIKARSFVWGAYYAAVMSFFRKLVSSRPPSVHTSGFAVIDTETTGFGRKARIVEIGVVVLDDNLEEHSRWGTLINPESPIPNSRIHGITDDMVISAPTFREVAGQLLDVLDDRILMAHNAKFDSKMITAEFDRLTGGADDTLWPFVCTIDLAKQLTEGPYRLSALAAKCGVVNPNAHAAVDDAATTAAVLRHLVGDSRGEVVKALQEQGQRFSKPVTDWSRAVQLRPRP